MARRRIVQLSDAGVLSVASESTFESEERLRSAIAAHPEVLPSEDVGLGPLVTVRTNSNSTSATARWTRSQSIARGAWRSLSSNEGPRTPTSARSFRRCSTTAARCGASRIDNLEEASRLAPPGFDGALVDHVNARLARLGVATFDADAFRRGVESGLDSGEFVFLYVARDLDDRTKRIMTYLAEGPRMTFFAVEVDYFRGGDGGAVLVPRVAFVPSWVTDPQRGTPPPTGAAARGGPGAGEGIARRMKTIVEQLGIFETHAHARRSSTAPPEKHPA